MKVVICGCGQVGMSVAENLSQQKHEITLIDRDADSFRKLEGTDGFQFIVGDATDQDILRKAETEGADAFLALTGEDNANLLAAQVARELFKIKTVVVRVAGPIRARAYSEMGLTTVCGTDLIADAVMKKIVAKK